MSDQELMHEVASGNEAAFGELYDRFGKLVFRVAWQFFPNRSESEDAVQEVFIRLWRTADRFDAERAKLVTWVMLIARRHMIDRLRRKQTTTNHPRLRVRSHGGWAEPNRRPNRNPS